MHPAAPLIGLALLLTACGGGAPSAAAPTPPGSPTATAGKRRPRVVIFGESHALRWSRDHADTLPDWTLITAGVGGQPSWEGWPRFAADALGPAPDLIVIWQGTNDVRLRPETVDTQYLSQMIDAARRAGAPAVICTLPPFISTGWGPRNVDAFNAAIRALAASTGTPVLDVARLIDRRDHMMRDDGLHLSPEGYAFIAPRLIELARL